MDNVIKSTPLSKEFITNLIKKADQSMPQAAPIFTVKENTAIKSAVKRGLDWLVIRGRKFALSYKTYRGEEWVTMKPASAEHCPMFVAPVKWVLDVDKEI